MSKSTRLVHPNESDDEDSLDQSSPSEMSDEVSSTHSYHSPTTDTTTQLSSSPATSAISTLSSTKKNKTALNDDILLSPTASRSNAPQTGIPTPYEASIELPDAHSHLHAYPHGAYNVTHTQVSKLGFLITATDQGAIHVWCLGKHDKLDLGTAQNNANSNFASSNNLTTDYSTYQFLVTFLLHTGDAFLSIMVSSCGNYCVSVALSGLVHILYLPSLSIQTQFQLPFIPTCSLLLQQLIDPAISNHFSLAPSTKLLAPQIQQTITTSNSSDIALCVGSITGHLFVYPLTSPTLSSIFVTKATSTPLLSLASVPLSLLTTFSKNNINPTDHPSFQTTSTQTSSQINPNSPLQLQTYPFLNRAEGYALFLTDTQGNIETFLLPRSYASALPDISSILAVASTAASGTGSASISTLLSKSLDQVHTSTNPTDTNSASKPTAITVDGQYVYWGSLDKNILLSPFNSLLYPTTPLKTKTDLFELRRGKLVANTIVTSPDGQYFALFALPKSPPTLDSQLSSNTHTPFSVIVFSTLSCKVVHRFREDLNAEYPSKGDNTLSLSSALLFNSKSSSNSTPLPSPGPTRTTTHSSQTAQSPDASKTMLLETKISTPLTPAIWSTVSLSASPTPTNVPNPFYLPSHVLVARLTHFRTFLDFLYKHSITPLEPVDSLLPPLTPPASTMTLLEQNLRKLQIVIKNGSHQLCSQLRQHITSQYRPLFGTSHSTSLNNCDVLLFDPTSNYLFYPTIFGIKTVRLRDGFTTFPSTTHSQTPQDTSTGSDTTNDAQDSSLVGSFDIKIDPRLIHTTLTYLTPDAYLLSRDAKSAITLLLSHHDDANRQQREVGKQITNNLITTAFQNPSLFQYSTTANLPHSVKTFNPYSGTASDKVNMFKKRQILTKLASTSAFRTTTLHASLDAATSSADNIRATIHTSMGDLQLTLFKGKAPLTVENFITLARRDYYNNLTFHRVIKDFMIQGGCPLGTGRGGESCWGGSFKDEFHPTLRHDKPGVFSMANSGKDTNGSQFFITTVPAPHLDDKHSIFGLLSPESISVLRSIAALKTDKNDKPLPVEGKFPIIIKSITIHDMNE